MKLEEIFLREARRETGWPKNTVELEARYNEWFLSTDTPSKKKLQHTFHDDLTVSVKGSFCIGDAFKPAGSVDPTSGRQENAPNNLNTTLPFKLKEVNGILSINGMKRLKTLEGCPETVSQIFNLRNNPALTDLHGAPKNIEGHITIADCKNLKTLKGLPLKVRSLEISNLQSLIGFEGFPEHYTEGLRIEKGCMTSLVGIADNIKYVGGTFELPPKGIKSGGLGLLLIEGKGGPIRLSVLGMLMKGNENPWRIIHKYLQGNRDVFACQQELIEAGFEEYAQL